jgi:dynein heavy chain
LPCVWCRASRCGVSVGPPASRLQYINTNVHVPWEDMRYVFGQIMYGGHITDAWDRRCNNTYLDVYMQPNILHGCELAPGFKVPDTSAMNYQDVLNYFQTSLPNESPPMFGLHPNAEIGYLTTFAEDLFQTILILGGTGGAGDSGGDGGVRAVMEDLLERCPEDFQMIDIKVCFAMI